MDLDDLLEEEFDSLGGAKQSNNRATNMVRNNVQVRYTDPKPQPAVIAHQVPKARVEVKVDDDDDEDWDALGGGPIKVQDMGYYGAR